ncbi:MAG TPA: MOSC domain-containing protein [Terriglobales bacterium]|nr:MOSC domain-containing protein [Terriglobales bacterium]
MRIGTVRELWRYPVKSMAGEQREAVAVTAFGIVGDRGWAVRDERRGAIVGAKKVAELMRCSARYLEEPRSGSNAVAEIRLPDGGVVHTGDPQVSARLSQALARPVTLWPLLSAEARDHFRRGAPDDPDMEAELRAIFGRAADEPLPDLSIFPPELFEYESLPGTYFDAFPLLLMTSASLRRLQSLASGSRVDVRRFRPNLVLETEEQEGFAEEAWLGRQLRIGSVTVETLVRCPRCVMITHEFADLPRDPQIMRTLVRENEGNLGVYARVIEPGTIARGDAAAIV